jgi:hypothetical protein
MCFFGGLGNQEGIDEERVPLLSPRTVTKLSSAELLAVKIEDSSSEFVEEC